MKAVSTEQMRSLDQRTIDEAGIPGSELMLTAGIGLADCLTRLAGDHRFDRPETVFVAGHGNNGGDAFVAAKVLHERGWPLECWLAASEARVKGDALVHLQAMKAAGVPMRILDTAALWQSAAQSPCSAKIVVDGLLGTGAAGSPRGSVASAIDFINTQSHHSLIVAIDSPSLMRVASDLTVAMGLPKAACLRPENVRWVGNLEVVDIGVPTQFIDEIQAPHDFELIDRSDLGARQPYRRRDSHKGTFGHALCVGGSMGFSGSITMAAQAASRSGVGLVSVLVPADIHALVAPQLLEAMTHTSLPDGRFAAVLLGPGMGRSGDTREQTLDRLQSSTVPVVLDADAISVLASHRTAIEQAACPVVLTPHPGEFATLFGLSAAEVQADRLAMARMAADELGATVVLKGAGTIVAQPGRPLAINLTGNPGMASGGSGDVLAGLIVGLVAQGVEPFDAAKLGVWLHGRAGDLAAAATSQASLIAPDLVANLPRAIRELSPR